MLPPEDGASPMDTDYILEVRVDIDPAYEEAWNRWYDEVHLPEIVQCPGFRRARRFVALEGAPKYIALYDMESERAFESAEFSTRRGWDRFKDHVKNPQVCVYKKIKEITP